MLAKESLLTAEHDEELEAAKFWLPLRRPRTGRTLSMCLSRRMGSRKSQHASTRESSQSSSSQCSCDLRAGADLCNFVGRACRVGLLYPVPRPLAPAAARSRASDVWTIFFRLSCVRLRALP